jgi:hypothetical protein
VTQVSETKEFRQSYSWHSRSRVDKPSDILSLWCYRGNAVTPKWKDVDTSESYHLFSDLRLDELNFSDNYTKLCTIEADLSQAMVLQPKTTGKKRFYSVNFDIILFFGMTELKAQVAWTVNVSGLYMLFHISDY